MAGSRIYKLGSIFTRVEGLLKAGGMQPSEQPLWLDVYRAFPPIEEPSFYRTAGGDVRRIFYPEDVARIAYSQSEAVVLSPRRGGGTTWSSFSDSNKEIDDGPLPTSSEVEDALALVRRYCVNIEGCGLSCSDSLDNVEACVLS
ncbi:hypothetical protein HPB49_005169 [Dermacentor silvarum]|uniref:Uncharacterized protein n=1 Tax=Dermacentor silvarum TaxID=543639 RepID=A0ACB8D333_DERSI|nr:hypothetical protein HPB49_005169 [Dermacentor silvarum]